MAPSITASPQCPETGKLPQTDTLPPCLTVAMMLFFLNCYVSFVSPLYLTLYLSPQSKEYFPQSLGPAMSPEIL